MVDEHERRKRVEDLVSQDPHINDTKMKDFRMQLQQNLVDWERRRARLWRIVCISAGAYLLEILLAVLYLNRIPAENQSQFFPVYVVVVWITFLLLGCSLALYFGKYAPAIRKLRYDVQSAMIAELQEQLLGLREELRARTPESDRRSG